MKLTIDRKRWGFGNKGGSLLNGEGKMCCLGFFALQCGYTRKDIFDKGTPLDIFNGKDIMTIKELSSDTKANKLKPLISSNRIANNSTCTLLITANDSTSTLYHNPVKRENRIKELFKRIGVAVKFIN